MQKSGVKNCVQADLLVSTVWVYTRTQVHSYLCMFICKCMWMYTCMSMCFMHVYVQKDCIVLMIMMDRRKLFGMPIQILRLTATNVCIYQDSTNTVDVLYCAWIDLGNS